MTIPARRPIWPLFIEYAFVIAMFAGYGYTIWFFDEYKYLPQPWFYEPSGTFMDWYSLSYFAVFGGAYEVNGTIYPPVSFVIMKIFSLPQCYANAAGEPSRDCDHLGIWALGFGVMLNFALTFLTFRKIDKKTCIPRSLALGLGFPMIYAFERGNLLLFCYTSMLLSFGPLLRSARWRWFFGGLALNFKVYLLGALIAPLLHRRWLQTEGMIIAAVLIYLVTWLILREGSPIELYNNVAFYTGGFGAGRVLDLWYASSFVPAISLLKGETFPIHTILDSRTTEYLLMLCTFLLRSAQIMIVLAAAATWLRPQSVPRYRPVFLALALALFASEAGGYTEILLLFFVFQERWKGIALPIAICLAYALCIPAEFVLDRVPSIGRWSWLAGGEVIADYGVGVFALLKPIIKVVIVWCIAAVTIRDVWVGLRKDGWDVFWASFGPRRSAQAPAPANGKPA